MLKVGWAANSGSRPEPFHCMTSRTPRFLALQLSRPFQALAICTMMSRCGTDLHKDLFNLFDLLCLLRPGT